MAMVKDILDRWQKNKAGEAIIKTSEEAILLGTLIYDKPNRIKEIDKLCRKTRFDVEYRGKQKSVNLDLLFGLAVKGQFYRECLEEVQRWKELDLDQDQEGK